MVKYLLAVFITILFTNGLVQAQSSQDQPAEERSLITDPAISNRCKALLAQRRQKIETRQRLHALLRRNEKLLKQVPQDKESIKSRLEFTKTKLRNNIEFSALQLRRMEEDIVRRGCPGILL